MIGPELTTASCGLRVCHLRASAFQTPLERQRRTFTTFTEYATAGCGHAFKSIAR